MTTTIALETLLHRPSATEVLRRAGLDLDVAQPGYVRHKPNETTIVAYQLQRAGQIGWGYAQWCADPARAADVFAKAQTLRPRASEYGPGLHRLGSHAVFYVFPNDAQLRKLRWYTTPRKLKRTLKVLTSPDEQISGRQSAVQILRYKPERRVVAKVDLVTDHQTRHLLLRYSTSAKADRLAAIATHLRRNGVTTPRPVAQLFDNKVTVDEFIGGDQLHDVIQRDGLTSGDRLARSLVHLHHVAPPPHIERRTIASELDRARSGLQGLVDLHPNLARPAAQTLALLTDTIPTETAPDVVLHGDLHAENVLISAHDLAFVDLERVALGPAAVDLGYFAAHALALAQRQPPWSPAAVKYTASMIDHYQQSTKPVDPTTLSWCTAIGLIDQALLAIRHLEPCGTETGLGLLNTAQLALAESKPTQPGVTR